MDWITKSRVTVGAIIVAVVTIVKYAIVPCTCDSYVSIVSLFFSNYIYLSFGKLLKFAHELRNQPYL